MDAVRTRREVDDPLGAARRGRRRPPPPTCPTRAQVCNCNGVCKGEIVDGDPRRAGSARRRRSSTSPAPAPAAARASRWSSELLALERGGAAEEADLPVPVPAPDARGARRGRARARARVGQRAERRLRRRPRLRRLQARARLPRVARSAATATARSATRASSTTASTRTSRTTARSRVVPRIRGGVTTAGRAAPDRRRRRQATRCRMVKITGGQRIDLLGVAQGAAPGDLGGARHAVRPRLREGGAHGQDVRRHRLLPLRARRRDRRRHRARARDGGALHAAQGQVGGHRLPAQLRRGLREGHRAGRRRGRLGGLRRRRGGRDRAQGRPARDGRRRATRRCGSRSPSSSTTARTAEYLERTYALPRARRASRPCARRCSTRASRRRCSSATGSPRPPPTPTRGASAATPSTRKQFAELDTEPELARPPIDAAARDRERRGRSRRPRRRTCRCSRAAASTVDGRRDRGLPPARRLRRDRRRTARTRGGPLADGIVADRCVTCPLHGRRFDLDDRRGSRRRRRRRRARGRRARRRALASRLATSSERGLRDREVRTTCPYCGVGCGLVAEVDGRPARRRSRATRCTRSTAARRAASRSRLPEAVHAPDRATTPLLRASRATSAGGRHAGGAAIADARAAAARDRRRARARRDRVLHLRPAADRGLLRGQQARQGLPRHEQRRLELAPVHVERGRRLHGRVRLRRAAAVLRRHRPGRLPARCSARTPRPATRSSGRGSAAASRRARTLIVVDPRRTPTAAARRPAPAGAARHRPRRC